MAGSITEVIRGYINLINESLDEAKNNEPVEFGVVMGSKFEESLKKHERVFPDLREKLKKFIEVKKDNPIQGRYGKHDSPFSTGTPLAGYMHCHLRDDAILIYTMKNRNINLLLVCSHAEIDGAKKASKVANLLAA
jgi:mRNA-degrading endonuclease YafQ of YafQ-DinJ toxin-antitoxin module